MSEKYIAIDLNDEKSLRIAEVIGNKTCKTILNALADKEMSESEIANELKIPMNTTHYNVQKLVDSGLVEKKAGFLWSVKGRKIEKYRLANKKILISPKRMSKGIIPVLVASVAMALLIKIYTSVNFIAGDNSFVNEKSSGLVSTSAGASAPAMMNPGNVPRVSIISASMNNNLWAWFLLGALFAILIYLIYDLINERRKK